MACCHCQGIETLFDKKIADSELKKYHEKGPGKTTQILIDALKSNGLGGATLLDIGGGVGVVQHELLKAGVEKAVSVEASTAYLESAKAEAEKQGYADRVKHYHGDFVALAPDIQQADIVTLDRVICCYRDMPAQVQTSLGKARKLYGVVYPRDVWWTKLAFAIQNFFLRLRRNPFRMFIHATAAVDGLIRGNGLRQRFFRQTAFWQVVVYERRT